jgi:hypothetical protein
MRGIVTPILHLSSRRGAYLSTEYVLIAWHLVKKQDNFTFTYYFKEFLPNASPKSVY